MAKPSYYPEWATSAITDGTTGVGNKIRPDSDHRNNGYSNEEYPTRQDINWLFDNINLWVNYFDTELGSDSIINESDATGTTVSDVLNSFDDSITNLQSHVHDGGTNANSMSKIDPIDNINGVSTGSFTANLAGFTVARTATVNYILETDLISGVSFVTMIFNNVSYTSGYNYFRIGVGDIPAAIRPQLSVGVPVGIVDNGVPLVGLIYIATDGSAEFIIDGSSLGWTTSGLKGITAAIIKYPKFS